MSYYSLISMMPKASAYDPDAQAFFTASGLTGATNLTAINQLVLDLKSYGIWTKMKAIYPMIGGTAALHKWNLKDPRDLDAAFRLVFAGGWTHSSTGAQANGTNGYADTFLNINTSLSINSHAINYYANTNSDSTNRGNYGGFTTAGNSLDSYGFSSTLYFRSGVSSSITTPSNNKGFFGITRTSSTNFNTINEDGTYVTTSGASYTSVNRSIYLGTINPIGTTGYSVQSFAFFSICDGLTQAEMTSLRTAVINYQITLGRYVGVPIVSDSDAQAFINAAYIIDNTQANAVNQLVIDMKAANIWTKMKAVYPFVGGTATTHKWNLKDPRDLNAAFRLTFSGGWTHSSTGAKPGGVNGYADTFLTPSTSLSQNSTHISYYSRTQSNGAEVEIGTSTGPNATDNGSLIEIRTTGTTYFRINSQATYITSSDSDSRAFYISNRTASNVINGWRNNLKVATGTTISSGLSTRTFWLGGFNSGGVAYYSTKECAFASIGDGLTDTEASNLYTAVQNFNTTLGRNI